MDRETATQILLRVRDGCDPETGEVLDPDHPYQRAELVRALYTLLAEPRRPVRPRPKNSGLPWTESEEEQLTRSHEAGAGIADLARELGRSPVAVRARLVKLGRLDAADLTTPLLYPGDGSSASSSAPPPS